MPADPAGAAAVVELAGIGPEDVVFDLGCGTGELLVSICQAAGCRGVGVELDAALCAEARARVAECGGRVCLEQKDLMRCELSRATVIYVYLLPAMHKQLSGRLDQAARRGARVVANVFKCYPPLPLFPRKARVPGVPRPYGELLLYQRPRRFPEALRPDRVTILAYGGLLSEASSRLTFPGLANFRLVRLDGWRRLFGTTHLLLAGHADPSQPLHLAALSVEPAAGCSFVAGAFEVELNDRQRQAFVEREVGYDICTAGYRELEGAGVGSGVICAASCDNKLPAGLAVPVGAAHVWDWPEDSGLRPVDCYLRHCLLAIEKIGGEAERSFLEETLLVDRWTTLIEYLAEDGVRERVMAARPPAEVAARFSG